MKRWQKLWVEGILPQFSEEAKARLKKALEEDSPTLISKGIALSADGKLDPYSVAGGCCPVAFCRWEPGMTVADTQSAFMVTPNKSYRLSRDGQGFLTWWDLTPRKEAIQELLKLM